MFDSLEPPPKVCRIFNVHVFQVGYIHKLSVVVVLETRRSLDFRAQRLVPYRPTFFANFHSKPKSTPGWYSIFENKLDNKLYSTSAEREMDKLWCASGWQCGLIEATSDPLGVVDPLEHNTTAVVFAAFCFLMTHPPDRIFMVKHSFPARGALLHTLLGSTYSENIQQQLLTNTSTLVVQGWRPILL